MQSLTSD